MNPNIFKFIIDLIDTCAERGAFRGDELQNVGAVRQILVDAVKPPEDEVEDAVVEQVNS
jgi:hypothetical protein